MRLADMRQILQQEFRFCPAAFQQHQVYGVFQYASLFSGDQKTIEARDRRRAFSFPPLTASPNLA